MAEEKDIPIEELLRMYGYDKPATTSDNIDQSTSDSSNSNNLTSQTQSQTTTTTTTTATTGMNNMNQLLSDSSDDDSDEDFSVNEDEWRRTIQVGSDFQAVIPDGLKHYEHNSNIGHNNILLWKPPATSTLNLDEYLLEYAKLSLSSDEDSLNDFVLPTGAHIKDDEQALFTLFQCKFDMKKALHLRENDDEPKAPISEPMTPWTEEECRSFENGLRASGKDFYQIKHSRIPTRSVGEVVSFYYLWKKTERHDIFTSKFRIEKKKYSLHPGTT
ncbi:mesoderm induction early response protein 1-like protein [Euroglyphus maynei]|uniref:Mesoderm induction early response protein 1-like protein n=1 Tax=Euroglyphus maynei TaxID=6958 RepID=A0A1Y3AXK7_EURMA|nr:mesoderm induction early response protein 1-like protein [Euroglyphus maynei]